MRTAVAMGADIDDEGAGFGLDFVDAQQEQHIEPAGVQHAAGIEPALARHETEIERADEATLRV